MKSHATHAARARNKRGSSVEVAWILRGLFLGVLRGFCEELNPFFCLNVNAKDINVSLTVLYHKSQVARIYACGSSIWSDTWLGSHYRMIKALELDKEIKNYQSSENKGAEQSVL